MKIILASGSPRRRQLLEQVGLRGFVIRASDVDESVRPGLTPAEMVEELSARKAAAVVREAPKDGLVLAADTVVALGHDILGKPADDADALDMLRRLSGREHEVITGVCCLFPDGSSAGFADTSAVRFHAWPEDVLRAYVRSGEPADKAGAYAIQGQGAFLVESVHGSWSTVVGLPVSRLAALLLEGGWMRPVD